MPFTPYISTRKAGISPVLRLHFQNEQKAWKEALVLRERWLRQPA